MNDNLFTYLKWRGDLSFKEAKFNEVDNLILANLAYIRLTNVLEDNINAKAVSIYDAYQQFIALPKEKRITRDNRDPDFFKALSESIRFKDLKLFYHHEIYDYDNSIQFGAITIGIDDNLYYVAYRGTDSAIIGWQEDLELAFKVVPAQKLAHEYLLNISEHFNKAHFYVGGHSKGGNLATYAASKLSKDKQERIIAIFNNDGPGFDNTIVDEKQFTSISDKIYNYVPESSVVSVIFTQYGQETVIDSSSISILQHDPYSWLIEGGHFIKALKRDKFSDFMRTSINNCLNNIPYNQKAAFADGVFKVIYASKAQTLQEIIPCMLKNFKDVQGALNTLDEKTKDTISLVFGEIFSSLGQSFNEHFLKGIIHKE